METIGNHDEGRRANDGAGDSDPLIEPLMSADEAAQLLHVPRSTVYELVRSRGLPHVKIGRRGMRFCRRDLAQWVGANTFASRQPPRR